MLSTINRLFKSAGRIAKHKDYSEANTLVNTLDLSTISYLRDLLQFILQLEKLSVGSGDQILVQICRYKTLLIRLLKEFKRHQISPEVV